MSLSFPVFCSNVLIGHTVVKGLTKPEKENTSWLRNLCSFPHLKPMYRLLPHALTPYKHLLLKHLFISK